MNKDNQIIADFMCNQYTNYVGKLDRYKWQLVKNGSWHEEKDLQYNKSWDWLMPVIKKCRFETNTLNDDFMALDSAIQNSLCNCEISNAFQCVIDFIEWYNNK